MIEATQRKLREAQFFLNHLSQERTRAVRNEPEAFAYYLSAFLSAARSVSWALQFEKKEKYDAWFPAWLTNRTAKEKELLSFVTKQRNYEQKRGGSELSMVWDYIPISLLPIKNRSHPVYGFHWSGPPGTPEPRIGIPVHSFESDTGDEEVVEVSRRYLALLSELVHDFVEAHSPKAV